MNFMNFEKIPERVSNFEKGKKEAIEKIKEMDLLLPHHRDLVLVMIGEKPLTFFSFATELEKKEMGEQFFEKLKDAAEKANLSIEKVEEVDEERRVVNNYFYVAQNKEIIYEALEAEKKGDHETLGKLYGYPETAAKAFAEAEKNPEKEKELLFEDQRDFLKSLSEEDRKQIAKERLLGFFEFRLSKAHWREELETVRRWKKALEEEAPELAKRLSEGIISWQIQFYKEYERKN
jgi:hypothetical protein